MWAGTFIACVFIGSQADSILLGFFTAIKGGNLGMWSVIGRLAVQPRRWCGTVLKSWFGEPGCYKSINYAQTP